MTSIDIENECSHKSSTLIFNGISSVLCTMKAFSKHRFESSFISLCFLNVNLKPSLSSAEVDHGNDFNNFLSSVLKSSKFL